MGLLSFLSIDNRIDTEIRQALQRWKTTIILACVGIFLLLFAGTCSGTVVGNWIS
jgi:hypothetical protein